MKRSRSDIIKVGLFVVLAVMLLAAGLLWIAGSRFFRPVARYTVLFDKSVSGLTAGANVEYQGVVVGRVRDISLTGDIPPKVAVEVDVDPDTPVRKDTVAALLGSIVTGIKFIQFQGGTAQVELLEPGGTIRGDVTSIEQFRDQLTEIADRAITLLRRLDENVLTKETTAKFAAFVEDLAAVAKSLSTTLETLRTEETGKNVAQLVREVTAATKQLNAVITDFYGRRDRIFGGVETTLRSIDKTVTETRKLVEAAQTGVSDSGGSLATLAAELSAATNRLQETLDVIRSDPSVLLWGRTVPEREFEGSK